MDSPPHIAAHKHCKRHRTELLASERCGCFYLAIFDPSEIPEWLDETLNKDGEIKSYEPTARCPRCGIDSVIGSASGYPITREFLQTMKSYIGGKELLGGRPVGWIRPMSAREHEEVSEYERQYEDGSDPRVLDIMDVSLLDPRPRGYQLENWLLDPERYWVKVGRTTWSDLVRRADPVPPLWINGHSTYNGQNDKIPLSLAADLGSSLRLVRLDRLTLSMFKPGEAFGNPKRRVQGRFRHEGTDYRCWVTDPVYERAYLAKSDGDYAIGESFLTISLGEPHDDACYKLIAAIIQRDTGTAA